MTMFDRKVAYSLNGRVWMGSLEPNAGDHREIITAPRPIHRPAFSPDGKQIALALEYTELDVSGFLHIVDIPPTGSTHISPTGDTALPNQDGLQVRAGGYWSDTFWVDN